MFAGSGQAVPAPRTSASSVRSRESSAVSISSAGRQQSGSEANGTRETTQDATEEASATSGPTSGQVSDTSTSASGSSVRRFRAEWNRLVPFLAYHHALTILASIPIVFMILVVAGCASSGSLQVLRLISFSRRQDTYAYEPNELMMNEDLGESLLEWSLNITGNAPRVVGAQAGYLANCVKLDPGGWRCGIKGSTVPGLEVSDPLGLMEIAHNFRVKTVSCGLIILSIILALAGVGIVFLFPGWHEEEDSDGSLREVQPFPRRPLSAAALLCFVLASIGLFISVVWQHVAVISAATLVRALRYESVEVRVGIAATAMGWFGVAFCSIVAIGLSAMIESMIMLARLIDGSV